MIDLSTTRDHETVTCRTRPARVICSLVDQSATVSAQMAKKLARQGIAISEDELVAAPLVFEFSDDLLAALDG